MFSSRCALALVALFCALANAREFQFQNNLPGEVWIGCLGNAGHAALNNGGWKLGRGQRVSKENKLQVLKGIKNAVLCSVFQYIILRWI